MLRCQASSRAAAEPNRREWGRKEERKWQTWTWGILGPTKNSTGKRRGEWWRVCRHNDEGNIGRAIFRCFKNEMFCGRNRKKKKKLLQLSACSLQSNKTRAILGTAVFYKSRSDWARCSDDSATICPHLCAQFDSHFIFECNWRTASNSPFYIFST